MKKISIILILLFCFATNNVEIFGQSDLLNKGKNLIKKKDKDNTSTNQNQSSNQNQNTNQNQNQDQSQNNQQQTYSSDDCAFYAKQLEKYIDAMEYQAEKGSDYSSSKRMAQENLDNLKQKCKPSDYEALEKKFNDLIAKIDNAEKPAKDKDALWAEHENFMQQFRKDLYDFYNEIFKAEYARSNSARLLNVAQKIDYPRRSEHADSICNVIWKPEELNKGTIWPDFVWIAKTFWELYPNKVNKEIEPAIQECIVNANKEKNPGGKWVVGKDWAAAAINYSNALKLLKRSSYLEGFTLGEKYEKDAKIIYDDYQSKIAAKFYTSKVHGDYAQKLVFSKKPIIIKAENPSEFASEFSAGDNVYAMGYFEIDLASFCTAEPFYNVSVFIDADPAYTGQGNFGVNYPIVASNGKNPYAYVELMPAFAANNQDGCLLMMRDFISNLKPGNHKIEVRITDTYAQNLAIGSFSIDCTADGLSKWAQAILPFEERELEKVRMPKAEQSNPALEAQMKKVVKEVYPDWTVLRLTIAEKEWTIEKNEITGRIEYRHIGTSVAIKDDKGECRVYWISFKQNYTNGKYGELMEHGVGGNEKIKCENVNK